MWVKGEAERECMHHAYSVTMTLEPDSAVRALEVTGIMRGPRWVGAGYQI